MDLVKQAYINRDTAALQAALDAVSPEKINAHDPDEYADLYGYYGITPAATYLQYKSLWYTKDSASSACKSWMGHQGLESHGEFDGVFRVLVNHPNVDPNAVDPEPVIRGMYWQSPIQHALLGASEYFWGWPRDRGALNALIDSPRVDINRILLPDADCPVPEGQTALMLAVSWVEDRAAVERMLLRPDIRVFVKSKFYDGSDGMPCTAIEKAREVNDHTIADKILKRGFAPLVKAFKLGAIVRFWIKATAAQYAPGRAGFHRSVEEFDSFQDGMFD